jgi:dTDP-4-dehydrorhamnose reductase
MKLLILGGQGMAGHLMVRYFRDRSAHDVFYTTRNKRDPRGLQLNISDWASTEKLVEAVSPDIVVNCVGILNQFAEQNPVEAFWINGIVPHKLKALLDRIGGKLVHISSDCVFSGIHGGHTEQDIPDGTSVYARSKALGEVTAEPHLTVRTSIIGPEIRENGIGLMQWFLNQQGTVKGYAAAIWNGITTLELAKFIHYVMDTNPIAGLVHATAPESISKYHLLGLIKETYGRTDAKIIRDVDMKIDRTLHNTRTDFQYAFPGYKQMLEELRAWM